jgi:hypothetical protein
MTDSPLGELQFLLKVQRLLDEGDFVATYKFALLNALADISVESDVAPGRALVVPLSAVAEKFIEYYWTQSRPYRAIDGRAAILKQNAGQQAAVINALVKLQQKYPTLAAARNAADWPRLRRRVAGIIVQMPLWKLQNVGGEVDEFLYRRADFSAGCIRLLPGVPQAFRSLHGLIVDAVRGAWIRQITRIAGNRQLLGDADLSLFLFGASRRSLLDFAQVLREHQASRCLYCKQLIRNRGAVDHFIPWARYPADLGHNLVLAHAGCNAAKRDFLAHPSHLERWRRSHVERADELAQRFDSRLLAHDLDRTRAIAWWAYEHGERTGAHLWLRDKRLERIRPDWREVLGERCLPLAAEGEPPPYTTSA